jgi:hypothetical protein
MSEQLLWRKDSLQNLAESDTPRRGWEKLFAFFLQLRNRRIPAVFDWLFIRSEAEANSRSKFCGVVICFVNTESRENKRLNCLSNVQLFFS